MFPLIEIALGISLIKSKNIKGPKMDPGGTPDVTGTKSDATRYLSGLFVFHPINMI